MKRWIWNILISIDQFFNVLLSPIFNFFLRPEHKFGYPDETLSSVFGKNNSGNCKTCYYICMCLHFLDKEHCKNSIEHDEGNGNHG